MSKAAPHGAAFVVPKGKNSEPEMKALRRLEVNDYISTPVGAKVPIMKKIDWGNPSARVMRMNGVGGSAANALTASADGRCP